MYISANPSLSQPLPAAGRAGGASRTQWDFWFVFALTAAGLFNLEFPWLSPHLFVWAPVVYGVARFGSVSGLLLRCGPLLALPGLAMLSTLWSVQPDETLYFGAQYLLTVTGALLIGFATAGEAAIGGLFAAFAVSAFLAFITGIASGDIAQAVATGGSYHGFTGSKNAFGDTSALGALLAFATLFVAKRRASWPLMIAALLILAINCLFIVIGRSTGAMVGAILGAATILILSLVRSLPRRASVVVGIAGLVAAIVLIAARHYWLDMLVSDVMDASGKDASLTGRVYIWERAATEIARHPTFGLGYSAFWRIGNLEAEAIWRALAITTRTGFNFHNTMLEIQVHLGLVGLAVFGVVAVGYAALLFARTYLNPEQTGVFFCGVLAYEISRMQYESIATWSFNYSTVMVFAAFAWAARTAPAKMRRSRQAEQGLREGPGPRGRAMPPVRAGRPPLIGERPGRR